jgi:ABC-type lipopolysaccharide export system ATPase subunit
MNSIRKSLGVCPQHDVLFDNLSVREHILFFSQLKGQSYNVANEEATSLTDLFHLSERLDHRGAELSGGQKRKLSVAIAICGGSRFILLDEPTAGMDPMARRELWDLLASLRTGRTILLTTHVRFTGISPSMFLYFLLNVHVLYFPALSNILHSSSLYIQPPLDLTKTFCISPSTWMRQMFWGIEWAL